MSSISSQATPVSMDGSSVTDRRVPSSSSWLSKATPSSKTSVVPLPLRMVLGAISGMGAASVCHPLDVIRVRLQTTGGSEQGILRTTLTAYQQGSLYNGIGAAYLRQWTYGSCRMGIYSYLLDKAKAQHGGTVENVPFGAKLGMGLLSGGIGSFVGTPSELALVRLTNDGKLPEAERRNYTGVMDCLRRIAKEEGGIRAWWTGATPTVFRACVLSACLMGGTSQAKSYLKSTGAFEQQQDTALKTKEDFKGDWLNGIPLLFCSTLISSFCANVCANPFDVVKSRMQNMPQPTVPGMEPLYRGSLDCLQKSVASEGMVVLSSGFLPAFLKLAPYTVISLTLVDTMTKAITGKDAL